MKPYTLVSILLLLFVFSGCSNDDDAINFFSLDGTWDMVNVNGGFLGIDEDFANGTIIWDFDETNFTVTITNNNTNDEIYTILPTGTYPYSVTAFGGGQEFIINEMIIGNFGVNSNNEFVIDQQLRDGFKFTFRR
ncbi:hypothetical protein [Aquimarina sp. 2201CG5-10]|uniref:hypothetical protein n=1 Tax=Aquimarina callyspongiae TaxID=3098150 RepID=UPI002AB36CEB|nr:hypothetical protein [Aquimarina sp. 2201CG5-10]MDY8135791.1 hypothetical protein [Aquimarina sp. 2201CG5-10]